jgi:hypothetical protein
MDTLPPANKEKRAVDVGGPVALTNFQALIDFVEQKFSDPRLSRFDEQMDRQLFPARLVPVGMGWGKESA